MTGFSRTLTTVMVNDWTNVLAGVPLSVTRRDTTCCSSPSKSSMSVLAPSAVTTSLAGAPPPTAAPTSLNRPPASSTRTTVCVCAAPSGSATAVTVPTSAFSAEFSLIDPPVMVIAVGASLTSTTVISMSVSKVRGVGRPLSVARTLRLNLWSVLDASS